MNTDIQAFRDQFILALARAFKVSPATIKHWVNGDGAPVPEMREPIYRVLRRLNEET
jgi:hypothetical protein